MALFEINDYDKKVYAEELRDFLPPKMIDIHAHVYLTKFKGEAEAVKRTVNWVSLIAEDNSFEDHQEAYRLFFPDKEVTSLMFSSIGPNDDQQAGNAYVAEAARNEGWAGLYYSSPVEGAETLEKNILAGGFLGVKGYLDLSPAYIPEAEIRILDFLPKHQLKVLDRLGGIVMLHIPRHGRFRDPVNLAQILEIKQEFPNLKLIIAHIGRAYCREDIGDAFKVLERCPDLLFDFCANTNEYAMTRLLESVGPERVFWGTDAPIYRMRMRRIEENGTYINLVPKGMYGGPEQDSHLREVSAEEAKNMTYFAYEEILAFKRAAKAVGLTKAQTDAVFYGNAKALLDQVRKNMYN